LLHRLQSFVLLLQFMQSVGALDGQAEHVDLERLGKEIIGAESDGAQRVGAIVLAGEDDDLGVGRQRQDLFEQFETLGDRIGVGRQTQIHGHHRRLVATHQLQGAFTIVGSQGFVLVERPADLLLQGPIVLDDEQWWQLYGTHAVPFKKSVDFIPDPASNSGNNRSTWVPTSSALSTDSLPPSS
jgi:hypothetical protein